MRSSIGRTPFATLAEQRMWRITVCNELPPEPRRGLRGPIGARTFRSIFCALPLVVCVVGVPRAAEITVLGSWVVLEGQIEPGDYDKLRDFLLVTRDYSPVDDPRCSATYEDGCPEEIYLASPGGDVAEAIKIGRLVRTLGWAATVPTRTDNSPAGSSLHEDEVKRYDLGDPKANFMCASACFFVFVGGIYKDTAMSGLPLILGIHRPYLSSERLKELSGGQAIAKASLTKAAIETYLRGMDVPTKYSDQMFTVPKDQILWISQDDFAANFSGFVSSLRDWIDAKCDDRTDIEKVAWENIKNKHHNEMTQTEKSLSDMLRKKMRAQWPCEEKVTFELRRDAWQEWRKETLRNIGDMCAARKGSLQAELATALSAAVPNQQSAAAALSLAQTAALCRDYGIRENAIRLLANRGDAKAQRILGNLFTFGGSTIAKNRVEGMTWYSRAGAQGDLFAQKYHRDLADKVKTTEVWSLKDYQEGGHWSFSNCPALC
jgi:hypothetical protein